jgi:hypothetical protein
MRSIEIMADHFRDLLAPTDINRPNTLNAGDSLYSATRAFRLIMQADGNLVLYAMDDTNVPAKPEYLGQLPDADWLSISDPNGAANVYTRVLWASGTQGNNASTANLQSDGNLVIKSAGGDPIWATNTNLGAQSQQDFLRCQDDGNLVLYSSAGAVLWATNTQARG